MRERFTATRLPGRSKGIAFLLLTTCALHAQATVEWQQVGGSLLATPTFKGIAGQGYTTPVLDDGAIRIQSGFLAHPLLVNNAPFVVSALPDLELASGYPAFAIDLDSVFADFEDDLAFSVSSTGEGTSTLLAGGVLTLSGAEGATGTSRIVVVAGDGTHSVADTFDVTASATTGVITGPAESRTVLELGVLIPRPVAPRTEGSGKGILCASCSADGDEGLEADLLLTESGTISVHIFDRLGVPVATLERTLGRREFLALDPNGDGRRVLPVRWNLRAAGGAPVATGVYLWKIEAKTRDGRRYEAVKRLGVN